MPRGNNILVNGEHGKGRYMPLFNGTGGDLYPGTIVQIDTSVALRAGVHTAVVYDRGADGDNPQGPHVVALETMQKLAGRTMTDAIPSGEMFEGYAPLPGDELNLRVKDADTGTSLNDVAAGTLLMVDDGTGYLIATTGSPEQEVAQLLEAASDLAGAELAWCSWAG